MSAKFLYSITDEKTDRRKQVGCMNGIFQLFDRRHLFAGQRVGGHSHKRLTPGKGQNANQGTEQSPAADRTPEKNFKENGKEKQSVLPESSTTSFSSSCSSTFSSIDCNKTTAQTKPSSFNQTIYPENPSVIPPTKQQDGSSQISSGLSVKTITKEGRMGPTMKHIDSPRPLLRTPKDAPRFSYDERESRDKLKSAIKLKELPRLSLDSRVRSIKSCASEPRSICISRETILNSNQEPGSNKRPSSVVARLMGLEEAFPDSNSTADDGQMIKIKSRPHEDVDRISRSPRIGDGSQQNQLCDSPRVSHKDPGSPQLRKVNSVIKPTSCSRFPLETAPWRQAHGSQKPEFKYREGITKAPNASPSVYGEIEKRLTELEFKKSGKDLRALKQILESMEKTRKRLEEQKEESPSNFESRINNFSPNYCRFDQSSKLVTRQSHQNNCSLSPNTKGTSSPKRCGSPIVIIKPAKLSVNPRDSSSDSSVIPADGISGLQRLRTGETARKDTVDRLLLSKDLTLRKSVPSTDNKTKANNLRLPISPKAPRNTGENLANSGRVSGTVSSRLQQKKHRMEKQSHATTPPRQSHKQLMESGSPIRKTKMKSTNLGQVDDDQSSRFSSETRNSSHNGDTVFSMQSESSLASQIDIEVTSINCSNDPKDQVSSFPIQNFAERLSEDRSTAELATATLEQPSPISVLDAMFYVEDPPSPVKKNSNFFEDDKTLDCDEAEWIVKDIDCLPNSTIPNLIFEFNHNKLEEAKHLIHKLRLVNTTRDETTMDQITYLCKRTIPDRRYIIEILFASGLLADQGSSMTNIQLHQSGHSINPNLFHLLEKIKGNTEFANNERCEQIGQSKSSERSQRKLVFDVVDEILVHKLALGGSSELGMFPNKKGMRSLSGEKLLKELWSEMDRLQTNPDLSLEDEDGLISILSADMTNQSEDWADYHGEVPGLVLDIERLIFKDLIREVVSNGAANMQDRRGRHCKQLFFK